LQTSTSKDLKQEKAFLLGKKETKLISLYGNFLKSQAPDSKNGNLHGGLDFQDGILNVVQCL